MAATVADTSRWVRGPLCSRSPERPSPSREGARDLPEPGLFQGQRGSPKEWPSGLGWKALGFLGALFSSLTPLGRPSHQAIHCTA